MRAIKADHLPWLASHHRRVARSFPRKRLARKMCVPGRVRLRGELRRRNFHGRRGFNPGGARGVQRIRTLAESTRLPFLHYVLPATGRGAPATSHLAISHQPAGDAGSGTRLADNGAAGTISTSARAGRECAAPGRILTGVHHDRDEEEHAAQPPAGAQERREGVRERLPVDQPHDPGCADREGGGQRQDDLRLQDLSRREEAHHRDV